MAMRGKECDPDDGVVFSALDFDCPRCRRRCRYDLKAVQCDWMEALQGGLEVVVTIPRSCRCEHCGASLAIRVAVASS